MPVMMQIRFCIIKRTKQMRNLERGICPKEKIHGTNEIFKILGCIEILLPFIAHCNTTSPVLP
jgi:hypothetical protein